MNKLIHKNSLASEINEEFDFFICSVSFEERCLSSARALDITKIKNAIIFSYPEFSPHNDKNLSILKNLFTGKVHVHELNNSDAIKTVDAILTSFSDLELNRGHRVLIDITTFTRESLLITLKVFHAFMPENMPTLLYNGAKKMSPEWLSKGLKECRSVIGYAGDFSSEKPLHLVVLLGFEPERAKSIIDLYEPAVLSIGTGARDQSITKVFYQENRKILSELQNYYGEIIDPFELSLKDPLLAKEALRNQVEKYPGHNIVIAPLNNKLSTIASGMLANELQHIQLCYSQVELYNFEDYSEPSDSFYITDEY